MNLIKPYILLLFAPSFLFAQEKQNGFVDEGLLRADGAFSIGIMPRYSGKNIYLNGSLEYYVDAHFSIRSDSYYLLQGNGVFDKNHSLFTGGVYHFETNSRFDPYLGLQPGISYSQPIPINYHNIELGGNDTVTSSQSTPDGRYNPAIAMSIGFNYYASKFFHLFIHLKYTYARHISDVPPLPLDEFKIAFGLGWNLRVKKK